MDDRRLPSLHKCAAPESRRHPCRRHGLAGCLLPLLLGCSPTHRIASTATAVGTEAAAISRLSERIESATAEPGIRADAAEIHDRAERIDRHTQTIYMSLPGVQDVTPWWASLLGWIAIATAGVASAWLVHALGVGQAIRLALGWIPRPKVAEARLAAAVADPDKPEDIRELIAARRASDPLFDAAWVKARADHSPQPKR
jgi:outer membrane murein-binding lipoprotein Lpp